jgi:hypothetical protein
MADFSITSLRGGQNDTDPAIAIEDDQAVLLQNVELVESMLGERRLGTSAITLPSFLSSCDKVLWIARHLPTPDETDAEFWALGITSSTFALGRKTSAWQAQVTIPDTPSATGNYPYIWQSVSIHGKLHVAFKSSVDRLHTWDGTSFRASGLKAPTASPTASQTGGGAIEAVRYYRVRYIEKSGSTVLRRSEPSAVLTYDPVTATKVTITKPAAISEGETHWELEASTDAVDFYVFATTAVGTTTVDDSTADGTGYTSGSVSEDDTAYTVLPSARYLTHDDDRLIWAGSYEDNAQAARVGWTPPFAAAGVGNDERQDVTTDPFKDLDTYKGGPITGISEPMLGANWVFKQHAIYRMLRTGQRLNAYDIELYTDVLGAIHGSVVSGVDEQGGPAIYFIDRQQGPCRIALGGIKKCGEDIRQTWNQMNQGATGLIASSLYYPTKKQIIWCLATGSANTPNQGIILHIDKSRPFDDGVRRGWVTWTGTRASALSMVLFADNIEANTTRSTKLVPYIAVSGLGLVHLCDTGNTDNSTAYAAQIKSKPYRLRSTLNTFTVMIAAILGKAVTGAAINFKCLRDFGLETTQTISNISFTPTASETDIIAKLDNLSGADMKVAQFEFDDVTTPAAQWKLNLLDIRSSDGQKF